MARDDVAGNHDPRLTAGGAGPRALLAESLSAVRVERIHATGPSFEDAFIWFIRHSHPVTA